MEANLNYVPAEVFWGHSCQFEPLWSSLSYLAHSWAFRYIWAILTFGTMGHSSAIWIQNVPNVNGNINCSQSPTSSHSALQIGRKRERLSGACAGALANWGHCHPVNVNIDVNLNENELSQNHPECHWVWDLFNWRDPKCKTIIIIIKEMVALHTLGLTSYKMRGSQLSRISYLNPPNKTIEQQVKTIFIHIIIAINKRSAVYLEGAKGALNVWSYLSAWWWFTWRAKHIFLSCFYLGGKNRIEKNLNKFCCHKHEIHLGHCHIAHCAEKFSEAKCPFVSIVFNSSLVLKFSWLAGLSTLYKQCLADDTKQVEEMNRASVASTKEIPWVSFSEMSFAARRSKGFRHLPQDIVIFVRFSLEFSRRIKNIRRQDALSLIVIPAI